MLYHVKAACVAGNLEVPTDVRSVVSLMRNIDVPTDVRSVLSLMRQGVQTIVDPRPKDAEMVAALPERDEALRFVEAVGAERYDALQRFEVVKASLSTKDMKLNAVQRATEDLRAKQEVLLRQIRNSTCKVSRLELDISRVQKRLAVSADVATRVAKWWLSVCAEKLTGCVSRGGQTSERLSCKLLNRSSQRLLRWVAGRVVPTLGRCSLGSL